MNFAEKLLRSAYGRPFFQMITGKPVPKELHCDIHEVLVVDKGIVQACIKDIQHAFSYFEILQKELHVPTSHSDNSSRFMENISNQAKALVAAEPSEFGQCFSQVVIRVINSIAESKHMIITGAQIREMAMRPSSQFFQDNEGRIKRSMRDNRMRQAAIVAALIMAKRGVVTIVSTQNFSTQN